MKKFSVINIFEETPFRQMSFVCVLLVVLIIGFNIAMFQKEVYLESNKYCNEKFGIGQWEYVPSSPKECGSLFNDCYVCKPPIFNDYYVCKPPSLARLT